MVDWFVVFLLYILSLIGICVSIAALPFFAAYVRMFLFSRSTEFRSRLGFPTDYEAAASRSADAKV